jgi:hypothetical protein
MGIGINVDVANCAFYIGQHFEELVRGFLNKFDRKWERCKHKNSPWNTCP